MLNDDFCELLDGDVEQIRKFLEEEDDGVEIVLPEDFDDIVKDKIDSLFREMHFTVGFLTAKGTSPPLSSYLLLLHLFEDMAMVCEGEESISIILHASHRVWNQYTTEHEAITEELKLFIDKTLEIAQSLETSEIIRFFWCLHWETVAGCADSSEWRKL